MASAFNTSTSGIVSNQSSRVDEPSLKRLRGVDSAGLAPVRWSDDFVIGTDIATTEFFTNSSVHYQIKGKPLAKNLEENWLNDTNRLSFIFSLMSPHRNAVLTAHSACQLYTLESMNYFLHKQQLVMQDKVAEVKVEIERLQTAFNVAIAAGGDGVSEGSALRDKIHELEEIEISPDWVESWVTYHGVCNTALPLTTIANRERVIVIIAQAMTDIVNCFDKGLTAHDRMFFLVKEECVQTDCTYVPSSRVSPITLAMPKKKKDEDFSYITQIRPVRQRERNITYTCVHKQGLDGRCQSASGVCHYLTYQKSINGNKLNFLGRVIYVGRVDLNIGGGVEIQKDQHKNTVKFQTQAKYPLSAWLCYT